MIIKFKSQDKVFTNDKGQSIPYTERIIEIDSIPFKISKADGKVFDLMFKDFINDANGIEVEL